MPSSGFRLGSMTRRTALDKKTFLSTSCLKGWDCLHDKGLEEGVEGRGKEFNLTGTAPVVDTRLQTPSPLMQWLRPQILVLRSSVGTLNMPLHGRVGKNSDTFPNPAMRQFPPQ